MAQDVLRLCVGNRLVKDDELARAIEAQDRRFRAELVAVPSVLELEAEGFTAVETLFGEVDLAASWPSDHLRWVCDTRYDVDPDDDVEDLMPGLQDGRLFMVRSPWPSVSLDIVVKLMFRWLRRNEDRYLRDRTRTSARIDRSAQHEVVQEFFRQSETWIRAYGKGRIDRLQ